MLAILVSDAEPRSRLLLELELDPSHTVVDPAPDAGGGEIIGVGSITAPLLGFG